MTEAPPDHLLGFFELADADQHDEIARALQSIRVLYQRYRRTREAAPKKRATRDLLKQLQEAAASFESALRDVSEDEWARMSLAGGSAAYLSPRETKDGPRADLGMLLAAIGVSTEPTLQHAAELELHSRLGTPVDPRLDLIDLDTRLLPALLAGICRAEAFSGLAMRALDRVPKAGKGNIAASATRTAAEWLATEAARIVRVFDAGLLGCAEGEEFACSLYEWVTDGSGGEDIAKAWRSAVREPT